MAVDPHRGAGLMTTREAAAHLGLTQRRIYDLLSRGRIPASRIGGKWMFDRASIDAWLARGASSPGSERALSPPAPAVVAGSHDPLLEWCIAESGCGLALRGGGSLAGLEQLAEGQAVACGMHVLDAPSGEYNVPAVRRSCGALDVVVIEWAWREQGLVLAPGNPLSIGSLADLARAGARLITRQPGAGSRLLLEQLRTESDLGPGDLQTLPLVAHTETEVGLAVLNGRADAGLAIRAVASQLRLGFVALRRERYDLVMRRRDYFEPAVQRVLALARSPAAAARAADLGGYELSGLGTVHYNAP